MGKTTPESAVPRETAVPKPDDQIHISSFTPPASFIVPPPPPPKKPSDK